MNVFRVPFSSRTLCQWVDTSLIRLIGLSVLVPSVGTAAPRGGAGWGKPPDASVHGDKIDWLLDITNVFCIILFVVMCIWMGIALVAHHHKKNKVAEYDHGDAKKQVTKALVLSALIFFIVDGNLWVNSTRHVNNIFWNYDVPEKNNPVRIEVNARQWLWEARYSGPDGKFNTADDPVTTNDIRVPVGRPVMMQLASPDVIHAVYLPHFRVKQDAMPGMINTLWFEAKETGEFELACVQNCGANHYQMKGVLTVLEQDEYERWVSLKSKDSLAVYDEKDKEAHWGWAWKRLGDEDKPKTASR